MIKITVRTRSQNEDLFNKMRSFIPDNIEVVAHTGYSEWQDASRFLHDVIEMTDGILLVCDEDCFITDWDSVVELCQLVNNKEYIYAGVPDGGVILHRCLSWVTANPFFVIFNCDLIKPKKEQISREMIDWHGYDPSMELYRPEFISGSFNHGNQEIFNGLFYWLIRLGEPYFMEGSTMGDGITTIVNGPKRKVLALHTWFSREYTTSEVAKFRIDHIYNYALKLSNHE